MKKACVVSSVDHMAVLKAMDAMTKLGITVVSVTDSGRRDVSLMGPPSDPCDRFHVFGFAESDDQIYKLSLDFSVDPQA